MKDRPSGGTRYRWKGRMKLGLDDEKI
jgi:hypothetical protein